MPLHERLDAEKVPEIMKRFNLSNILALPLIDRNDPVCRYYNFFLVRFVKLQESIRFRGFLLSIV